MRFSVWIPLMFFDEPIFGVGISLQEELMNDVDR